MKMQTLEESRVCFLFMLNLGINATTTIKL